MEERGTKINKHGIAPGEKIESVLSHATPVRVAIVVLKKSFKPSQFCHIFSLCARAAEPIFKNSNTQNDIEPEDK